MKRFLTCLILMFLLAAWSAQAAPLDEISSYEIQVDPRDDGTLDMRFDIQWKVLNDTQEGPLEWVRIGIPNRHVDEIEGLSDSIRRIAYDGSGGSYVRIDLDRDYRAGETVEMSFAIHQSSICAANGEDYVFHYMPGWFDDIAVKSLVVRWNAENALRADANALENLAGGWRTAGAGGVLSGKCLSWGRGPGQPYRWRRRKTLSQNHRQYFVPVGVFWRVLSANRQRPLDLRQHVLPLSRL